MKWKNFSEWILRIQCCHLKRSQTILYMSNYIKGTFQFDYPMKKHASNSKILSQFLMVLLVIIFGHISNIIIIINYH